MPVLTIDLATTILDERMKVHLVRPGAKYSFFRTIEEHSVLPVDAPLLSVEEGKPVAQSHKIQMELERARVLRDWIKQSEAKRGPKPSTKLESYSLDLVDPSRAAVRTRIRNAANDILWGLPGGTLVVIPSKSLSGNAILARLAHRKDPRKTVEGRGRNAGITFPARTIIGLKKVPMIELPADVLKAARTVKVIQHVSGHAEDRILRLYYGDYQKSNEHVAGLTAGTDDFDARIVGQMIELHLAMAHTISKQRAIKPGEALFNKEISDDVYFHARVDSPLGRTFLESATAITFAVKLMLIVAGSGISTEAAAQAIENGDVVVTNSKGTTNDETVLASKDALVDFAKVSGYSTVSEYLKALQDGLDRNSASISGDAHLED